VRHYVFSMPLLVALIHCYIQVRPRTKKQKSSSTTQELSGLVPGWKKAKAPQPDASNLSRAPSSASTRTTVSRRASSTVTTDHEDGAVASASASDGDPAFVYGGIPSDEEEVERPGLQYGAPLTNRYRVRHSN
jgi:hypothetical protein